MDIVVFGAGSLGSLVGGVLADVHDVTLVGRGDHVAAVRTDGLAITGELETTVHPNVTTDGTDLDAELAVVTVKSFDTTSAAAALATGSIDVVLSLQNGMGNEEALASRLESPVLAGTASYGARSPEPGIVDCTGIGEIVLGPRDGGSSNTADRVGEAFELAGLETIVAGDMPRRLWEKLGVNAGINAVTALARTENGAVLEKPARDVARRATCETARVARACDVALSDREAVEAMESVASATAANTSSMLQDVHAGRRTEVDAINGYVLERARESGLEVPTNRTLAALLRAWERGEGVR
ncbi:ketopantoate reductase family protein [Natrialbaceae archaeon AArc-T1-2]|uniref:ketopantoate reductase family protein n=1 Tax=Natrialbaceae archaeon AArc-T1-2 TaxID=3053904 RepID=UPI00255A9DCA|nr:ketopantoate reductase family protein [Natrialbaceae archaeon AArc-T1-2]WIV65686.1 ketopantoate reductase family protein [Natrialbaceae archaeon AArc-T1-2]